MLFICLFMPAIIAVAVYSKIRNQKIDVTYFIINYAMFLLSINYIITFILSFITGSTFSIIENQSFSSLFSFKYLSISLLLAITLPVLFTIISKNIKIKITFDKDKKNEK